MNDLIREIDFKIEKYSLLKHDFYKMWSEGKLTVDHLKGYSREYFQLVKAVPSYVENIASAVTDPLTKKSINQNLKEEYEHIEPWINFAGSIGVSRNDLVNYNGLTETNNTVWYLHELTKKSLYQAVAAMYAYEAQLPKISESKIDGLKRFYNMNNDDALRYFQIHEKVDVIHSEVWRNILQETPADKHEPVLNAAVRSLELQNELLDCVQEKYVRTTS